jgi:hypothetical protein
MSLKSQNKIFLSWDDVEYLVNKLCLNIQNQYPNIDSIHGVARGGLIPAVMVSHILKLPYTNIMMPNTLVIDDICDSGKTLKNIHGVYTGALHFKPHTSLYTPNVYAAIHSGDEFIYYPWEDINAEPIADYLIKTTK